MLAALRVMKVRELAVTDVGNVFNVGGVLSTVAFRCCSCGAAVLVADVVGVVTDAAVVVVVGAAAVEVDVSIYIFVVVVLVGGWCGNRCCCHQ